MHRSRHSVGAYGEDVAAIYLGRKGYRLITRNYRTRSGEIDLIADRPDGALAFVEVKARVGDRHGSPYEAVTRGKLTRLSKSIQLYLLQNNLYERTLRLEVISIIFDDRMIIKHIDHFDSVEIDM